MFRLKLYCNDNGQKYWEDGCTIYETYDKALIACYENSLQEVQELMPYGCCKWFETDRDFEITDTYADDIVEQGSIFPVATVVYDKAPWDRENDCTIKIITGYQILKI